MIIYSHTKNQVNISIHSEIKWWQLNIWPNFIVQARAITRPKIIGPERNVNLICNSSLYTHTLKIKSICPSIVKKMVTTKYLAKFQSSRAITRPKIIGPERNVNLICNSSLYTNTKNQVNISKHSEKSGDN
jgi:hypothetical protein